MKIEKLVWDAKVLEKIEKKHCLTRKEVEEIFEGSYHIRRFKKLYHAYGQSAAGRYIFVVFFFLKQGKAYIVTARNMTQKERRLYQKWKGG